MTIGVRSRKGDASTSSIGSTSIKPAWGKHVPKAKVEISEKERIRRLITMKNAKSTVVELDPNTLPPALLDRRIEKYEGGALNYM